MTDVDLPVDAWEEAAYRVADHTNSPPVDPADLDRLVVHYPVASTIGTDGATIWTRQLQRSYVNHRHYSLGYSFVIYLDGTLVEVRGFNHRNAANAVPGDRTANRRSLSVLFAVTGSGDAGQPANAAQIAAMHRLHAHVATRIGRTLPVVGHGDLEPTGCPGGGLRDQIAAGVLNPKPSAPLPPPERVDLMIYLVAPAPAISSDPNDPHFAVFASGNVRRAVNTDYTYAQNHGVDVYELDSPDQYDYLRRLAGV